MSDISDVLVALATVATGALYPNGASNPSVTQSDIIIYPGWPASDNLDQDLAAGKTHVSVFPKAEERNTTRYSKKSHLIVAPAPTLTLTTGFVNSKLLLEGGGQLLLEGGGALVGENLQYQITVGGTVSIPQNVMLRVNSKDYVYGVQESDTLASIASALAGLVAVDIAGTSSQDSTITIGPGGRVQAERIGGFGTIAREVKRQERIVMLTVWSGTPELRDSVAASIDVCLADKDFVTMPDGFAARLIYKNSLVVDSLQKAALYRRDLNYSVEFATTKSRNAAAVIAPKLTIDQGSTTTNVTL